MPLTSGYLPPNRDCWKGRVDGPNAKRIHEAIELIDLTTGLKKPSNGSFGILGFACDEGVRRNGGRIGAAAGPDAIRKALANIPLPSQECRLYDCGTITCTDSDLEAAQQRLANAVSDLIKQKITPLVIGGGHEVTWGNYQGIEKALPKANIAIFNFDAHFDLRPLLSNGLGHSGSSFKQIADNCNKKQKPFNYCCLGVQQCGNTTALFETAKILGTKIVLAEELHLKGMQPALEVIDLQLAQCDAVYLTICLDVFAAPYVPGVSAPQPLGLLPWHVIPLLRHIAESGKVIGIDIAELCPALDCDDRTAKLAANLLYYFLASTVRGPQII
jgi:formiminoglutamase